jgi:hypothetical protein
MKKILLPFFLLSLLFHTVLASQPPKSEFYEIKVYHVTAKQIGMMDNYLKNAYLPALNRAGVKSIGVFKDIETDSLIYVFTPLKSLSLLTKLPQVLAKDQAYQAAGKEYIESTFKEPAYTRMETIVLEAFGGMPQYQKSGVTAPMSERVYELRSYESPSETRHLSKVDMFNSGEIDVFKKLDFNPVFFAKVIAGSKMPNLMYMTTFPDRATRDARWKSFGSDPDWGKLKVMPKYQNNMNKSVVTFVRPTDYSEI